ncbi:OPT/YSL family transporter [uncultured Olsenella sp.]|uniref:OPT/YSL family transporter n=1 Tax=uncultured Olsenella sp. TaxID=190764 RepID=UPI0026DB09C3|nr:OPT/YSL family transporter [uncultured Olsenella sp.]
MDNGTSRASWRGQLTLRGVIIGCVGCAIITASSVYTALRLGALPWPIIFAAVISLFFLKLLGNASLNEANVTHTIMSAGAMVAGGLAFTIPGAWMLGLASQIGWVQIFLVALAGTGLGLVCTALIHRHFIVDANLEFPTGNAAAQTLRATEAGGRTGRQLFGSMGVAGTYALLRDGLHLLPAMLLQLPIPGVAFGIYNSPMMLSVGFLIGGVAVAWWLLGGVVANFGIVVAGSAAGLWDVANAQGIVKSLGMGLMMGSGVAVVIKDILPQMAGVVRGLGGGAPREGHREGEANDPSSLVSGNLRLDAGILGLATAAIAVLVCFGLQLGPIPAVAVVLLTFVTTIMSAQSCGQTGIDPMEIFGLIVLLLVSAFARLQEVQLFFIAGVVAVACGLAGDVMNDFKAGHVLGTDPRAQWLGQAIGGVLGALVAAGVMVALVSAYGPDAFGPDKEFVSAQASVVATMVSGIPSVPAFVLGLAGGLALYFARLPAMMLGLGVYLPFYMSVTAALGAVARIVYEQVSARRNAGLSEAERQEAVEKAQESGLVVASGLLGGESVMGVIIAFASIFASMA